MTSHENPSDEVDRGGHDPLWEACAKEIRSRVGDGIWMSTFRDLQVLHFEADRLILGVHGSFIRDRIERDHLDDVRAGLKTVERPDATIQIEVLDGAPVDEQHPDLDERLHPGTNGSQVEAVGPPPELINRPSQRRDYLMPQLTFESFVPGPANDDAFGAAVSVANHPGVECNPLFILGDTGLGKTHLMQAIANQIRGTHPEFSVCYVRMQAFLDEFVDAILRSRRDEFNRKYRNVDVLLADDVHFLAGKPGTQEAFFHAFNNVYETGGAVILSSDHRPYEIEELEKRLASRFAASLNVTVEAPGLEHRMAILAKKAEDEQPPVPPDVIEWIAHHFTTNIRQLEGALTTLCYHSRQQSRPITPPFADEVLRPLLGNQVPSPITVAEIVNEMATALHLPSAEILGPKRQRPLVRARHIAMYLARELTELSYPDIARQFDDRDHTTVINGVKRAQTLLKEDPELLALANTISTNLQSNR